MKEALDRAFTATQAPKWVIAAGDQLSDVEMNRIVRDARDARPDGGRAGALEALEGALMGYADAETGRPSGEDRRAEHS